MRRALSFVVFLVIALFAYTAWADAPSIDVSADAVVEVGGTGTVKMQVTGASVPQDPQMAGANNLVSVGGQNVFNLSVSAQQLLVASWTIRGRAVGTVTLTPSI